MWITNPITWMMLLFVSPDTAQNPVRSEPAACLLGITEVARWPLPEVVREASGLHSTGNGEVWVHGDEQGSLIRVGILSGSVDRAISLGDPAVRGDFEGVTVLGNDLYLLTSEGDLYRTRVPLGETVQRSVEFERARTDLRRVCELEGITSDAVSPWSRPQRH